MNIKRLLSLSRPRFWTYLAGPYVVGYTLAARNLSDFQSATFWYSLFYFLVPANLFLYGINDYFDRHIDRVNPKKKDKETSVSQSESALVINFVLLSLLFVLPLLAYLNRPAISVLLCFLVLSAFYSAPPIRLKTIPFLDSISNMLYILPGILGYVQLLPGQPSLSTILYLACWPAAMHLFSAIPDIESDKKSGIETSATVLGKPMSLLLCLILWLIFAIYATSIDNLFVVSFIYPSIPFYLLYHTEVSIERAYWKFPLLNTMMGGGLVIYLLITKFAV